MTDPQPSLEGKSIHRRQVAIRRAARGASRLGVHLAVLVVFVASCMLPGPYQQGQYQQGQYQQGQYQQGPYGGAAATSQAAGAAMRVVYQQPTQTPEREEIRTFLQVNKTFDRYASGLSRIFQFPQAVTVVWTECGTANAAWDGQGNILMCYEMFEFLQALFSKRIKNKKQRLVEVMSALTFIFLHELGHALISIYNLPSVGREEDAADQLAGLVLIATGDVGVEVAMRGAQFFRLLALSGSKTPFFDEHSLDAQRYYNVMCLVYGSNPEALGALVGRDKLPASRARRCPREYSKISAAWSSLLNLPLQKGSYADQPSGNRNPPAPTSRRNPDYSDDSGDSDDSDYPRNSGTSRGSRSSSGSGQWRCRAVGTYVPAGSDGPDYSDPQNVDVTEWGNSHYDAGSAALDTCSGLLNLSANSTLSPGSLVTQYCEVIQCSQQ
jgi:Putative metallopeptidase